MLAKLIHSKETVIQAQELVHLNSVYSDLLKVNSKSGSITVDRVQGRSDVSYRPFSIPMTPFQTDISFF